jgi:hypothetical protein
LLFTLFAIFVKTRKIVDINKQSALVSSAPAEKRVNSNANVDDQVGSFSGEEYCDKEPVAIDFEEAIPETPTPRPLTNPFLIKTPNKPRISKSMHSKYAAHLICAFRSTLGYVKETCEKRVYEDIKQKVERWNRVVLKESLVMQLETIFSADYSQVEETIMKVTAPSGDDQAEEQRFNFLFDAPFWTLLQTSSIEFREFYHVRCQNGHLLLNVFHRSSDHFEMHFLKSTIIGLRKRLEQ